MKYYLKALAHYADFSGRARRGEYWMFTLYNGIFLLVWMAIALVILTSFFGYRDIELAGALILAEISCLAITLLPRIALTL